MPRLKSPKAKGDEFERTVAAYLNEHVYRGRITAYRAPLSGGGRLESAGGADITGAPLLFIEAKRTEKFRVHEAVAQATYNAGVARTPDYPTVITRRNRQTMDDALVTMRLKDFCRLYHAALVACSILPAPEDDPPTEPGQTSP